MGSEDREEREHDTHACGATQQQDTHVHAVTQQSCSQAAHARQRHLPTDEASADEMPCVGLTHDVLLAVPPVLLVDTPCIDLTADEQQSSSHSRHPHSLLLPANRWVFVFCCCSVHVSVRV